MGAAVLAGIIFVIYSVFSSGGINNPPPGKVWSPEHGHWHDAPTAINPNPSGSSAGITPPPGPEPEGKIWSPEHGHWHDAPTVINPTSPEPSTELIPQPPGEVPDGKIWSPEHGHWHNSPNISTP